MLKRVEFSNIYNFIEPQVIEFNSKSKAYVIMGPNATGKTNLLDIIDNVGHSLYRKPNYNYLKRIVNQNSGSSIITFGATFVLNNKEYDFKFEIDVEAECYLFQELRIVKTGALLFRYQNEKLTSDVLSDNHISALKAFNIKQKGVLFYVNELDVEEDTIELRGVRKCAKYQDYIEFELSNVESMSAITGKVIKLLNDLQIDVRDIIVKSTKDVHKKQIQARIVEKNKLVSKVDNGIKVELIYDNYSELLQYESKGVIKLLDLCSELYAANSDEYFVPRLIDEMSTSLSSSTFFYMLNEFMENTNRQLVFTTNNQLILENKTLPKESIIFLEKTDNGSVVSKLSDYKFVRNDKRHNWRKLYEGGQLSKKHLDS